MDQLAENDVVFNAYLNQGVLTTSSPQFANLIITAGGDIKPSANSTTAINIAQADGTNFVSFDTTNKFVGIGGTPGYLLDVQGANNAIQFRIGDVAFASRFYIKTDETNGVHMYMNYGAAWYIGCTSAPTGFSIRQAEGESSSVRLYIEDTTGNIGVSTTIPNAMVAINQDADSKAFSIDSEATTAGTNCMDVYGKYGLYINQDISGGYGAHFYRNIAEAGSNALVKIQEDNTASTSYPLHIINDGTTYALYIDGFGSAGTDGPGIYCQTNYGNYTIVFFNDGNDANRYGIKLQHGTDDNSGTNVEMIFMDGNGDSIGSINSTGGTVSYSAFTGSHIADIPDFNPQKYIFGKIVCINKTIPPKYAEKKKKKGLAVKECHQPSYEVKLSAKAYDKTVFGVYSHLAPPDEDGYMIYALGDGFIYVCDQNGNIENGDYITTSDTEGIGMKQDDDILHNYTVAKTLEPVDWSKETKKTKLIACTYHSA